jgi:hypothetical protein
LAQTLGTIRNATPEIVGAVIEKAKAGSYLHARFLFELASMFPLPTRKEPLAPAPDLALEMLKRLRLIDPVITDDDSSSEASVHVPAAIWWQAASPRLNL